MSCRPFSADVASAFGATLRWMGIIFLCRLLSRLVSSYCMQAIIDIASYAAWTSTSLGPVVEPRLRWREWLSKRSYIGAGFSFCYCCLLCGCTKHMKESRSLRDPLRVTIEYSNSSWRSYFSSPSSLTYCHPKLPP